MSTVFIVVVVIAVLFGFYIQQQSSQTLKRLQADGFTVDESIQSNPQLVIDRQRQRMAVIHAKSYDEFSFSQIESVGYKVAPGDSDRDRKRIMIRLKDHAKSSITIKGRKDRDTDKWLATIEAAANQ